MKSKINHRNRKLHTVIVDSEKMKLTIKQIKELKDKVEMVKEKTCLPISEKSDFYGIIFCEDEMR